MHPLHLYNFLDIEPVDFCKPKARFDEEDYTEHFLEHSANNHGAGPDSGPPDKWCGQYAELLGPI